MKTKKNLMLIVGLLTILVLSACGTQAAVTTEAPVESKPTESVAVETAATPDLSKFTDAEMEAFLVEKADGNHTLEFMLSKDFDAEEWSATIDEMIGYGAKINAYEKAAIIEWLLNR